MTDDVRSRCEAEIPRPLCVESGAMLSSILSPCCHPDIATADNDEDEDGLVKEIILQPGKLEIQGEWTTGMVLKVRDGGYANRQRIKEGWQFKTIDGDPYDENLLRAKITGTVPYKVTFLTKQPGRQLMYRNEALNAPNVWTLQINPDVIDEAAQIFKEEVLPVYLSSKQAGFRAIPEETVAYSELQTATGSRFLAVHPTQFKSDLAWINVDDEATFRRFENLFHRSGVIEYCKSFVDHDCGLRLFNVQLIVRSFAHEVHMHVDYTKKVGTDSLSLMTPITPVLEGTRGFNLLYKSVDDEVQTYTYRHGEAIVFGSGFLHSTEPGESAEPRGFLCFTFGTDREELWPNIFKTIGTQTRMVCRPGGHFTVGRLGKLIEIVEQCGVGF